MDGRLHDDELEVDETLVRRLLGTLSVAYDDLPLRRFEASGSTNALFRLGDDLLVRVPRQPGGTTTIDKERRWLPYVAQQLPVAVPEIVAVGEPGFGYPERWSVVRFIAGDLPDVPRPGEPPRHGLATDLAEVVGSLDHLAVPPDAASDPALEWYRGRPLAAMDDDLHGFLARLARTGRRAGLRRRPRRRTSGLGSDPAAAAGPSGRCARLVSRRPERREPPGPRGSPGGRARLRRAVGR